MANFDFSVQERGIFTISVNGDIESGDSQTLEELADHLLTEHGAEEGPTFITVSFDSDGGDFMEGILIGKLLNRRGFRSLVKADAKCYSAAATAFLGGAGLGATSGWFADRVVEHGASIGFHTFYISSNEPAPLGESVDLGRFYTNILFDYAASLRININFIVETLETKSEGLLLLNSAERLRTLGIKLIGYEEDNSIDASKIVNIANYATNWQRPISLNPDGTTHKTEVVKIAPDEFKKSVLERLVERFDETLKRQETKLLKFIRDTVVKGKEENLGETYSDLLELNLLPYSIAYLSDEIYYVDGFQVGAGFYVTDCYVLVNKNQTEIVSITVLLFSTLGELDTRYFSKAGDIFYELHDREEIVNG